MKKNLIVNQQRFGHLTALYMLTPLYGQMLWFCQCDCGKFVIVAEPALHYRKTTSCGCTNPKSPQ